LLPNQFKRYCRNAGDGGSSTNACGTS
jgi:hypothetical protein